MKQIAFLCSCSVIALVLACASCRDSDPKIRRAPREVHGRGFYYDVKGLQVPGRRFTAAEFLTFAKDNPDSEFADEALLEAAEQLAHSTGVPPWTNTRAMEALNTVIVQYPNSAFCDIFAGWFGRPPRKEKAHPEWDRHVRNHPNFSADIALRLKAVLYEKLGNTDLAIRLLEEYVAKYPEGIWPEEDAEYCRRTGALPGLPRSADYLSYELVRMYCENGRCPDAEHAVAQVASRSPFSLYLALSYDLLAATYEKQTIMMKRDEERQSLLCLKRIYEKRKLRNISPRVREWAQPAASTFPPRLPVRPLSAVEKRLQQLQDSG